MEAITDPEGLHAAMLAEVENSLFNIAYILGEGAKGSLDAAQLQTLLAVASDTVGTQALRLKAAREAQGPS